MVLIAGLDHLLTSIQLWAEGTIYGRSFPVEEAHRPITSNLFPQWVSLAGVTQAIAALYLRRRRPRRSEPPPLWPRPNSIGRSNLEDSRYNSAMPLAGAHQSPPIATGRGGCDGTIIYASTMCEKNKNKTSGKTSFIPLYDR